MGGFSRGRPAKTQQCSHCGRQIHRAVKQCPYCREAQAESRPSLASAPRIQPTGNFRSGLLLMLLSAVAHYFAGGTSPLLPGETSSRLLSYMVPVLFVSGLAISLRGVFQRLRA